MADMYQRGVFPSLFAHVSHTSSLRPTQRSAIFVVPSAIKEGSEGMRMEYYKCTLDGCTGNCELEYKYFNGDAYNPYIDEPHEATGSACTSGTSSVPASLVVRSSPGAASPASVKMSWASNQS